ncbi:MAG: hypothetical protein ABW224_19940, partial [Kibdelosporangium sp.]
MVTSVNKLTPPGTILAAFFGFLVSTVSALVTAGLVLGARQELATAARASNPQMTEDQLQQTVTIAQGIAV